MQLTEDDPYQNLGHAIIIKAARDYRRARNKHLKNPSNIEALEEMESIEEFFHSGLFGAITDLDPDELIKRLREEKRWKRKNI